MNLFVAGFFSPKKKKIDVSSAWIAASTRVLAHIAALKAVNNCGWDLRPYNRMINGDSQPVLANLSIWNSCAWESAWICRN